MSPAGLRPAALLADYSLYSEETGTEDQIKALYIIHRAYGYTRCIHSSAIQRIRGSRPEKAHWGRNKTLCSVNTLPHYRNLQTRSVSFYI